MAQHPTVPEAFLVLLGAVARSAKEDPLGFLISLLWLVATGALLSAVWGSLREHEPRAAWLYGLMALGLGVLGIWLL